MSPLKVTRMLRVPCGETAERHGHFHQSPSWPRTAMRRTSSKAAIRAARPHAPELDEARTDPGIDARETSINHVS